MLLDTVNKKIQAFIEGAHTTTAPAYNTTYADITSTAFTPANTVGSLNGATAVDIVAVPGAGTFRHIKEIQIYNTDSVQHTITVRELDTATPYIFGAFVVPSGNFLRYAPETGWQIGTITGPGTVTSVAMTGDGTVFNAAVPGSPIVGAGTLAPTLHTQAQKTFFSGPASGADAAPTFRAVGAGDLPDLGSNPSATGGDVAVNGSAITYMRSDGAPAIQKTSSSLFGLAKVDNITITASAGVISTPGGANPSAPVGLAAVNGSAATFLRSDGAPALDQGIVPTWTGIHTFSNRLLLANGSASAPELAFNTNHGLFYDTTNGGLGVSAAGTQVAYFAPAGGLGTFVLVGTGALTSIGLAAAETSAGWSSLRASNNASPATNVFTKGRGTLASSNPPNQNDQLGAFVFRGLSGTGVGYQSQTFAEGGRLIYTVIAPTPSATDMQTRLSGTLSASGSVSPTEVFRFEVGTGFSLFGANPVIDQNRVFRPLSSTVAGIPAVTTTGLLEFSDEAGRSAIGYTDGVAWRRSGDNQVASATVDYRGVWSNLSARGSSTLLTLIQGAYQKLSDAGLLTKLKGLWVHAMPNQADALLNWITPGTRNLTTVGSPTFNANLGFTGDGATAQLTTGATFTTFGAAQNDVTVGCYVRTASAAAAAVIGQVGAATRRTYMQSRASGNVVSRLMDTTDDTFTPARYTGLFTLTRAASGTYAEYLDDSAGTTITRTSSNGTAAILGFLATTDATASEFSTAEISFSFVGTNMSAADIANLRAIMVDYFLVGVGARVNAVVNLPPAATFVNTSIYVPDLGGGAGSLRSNTTNWLRENMDGYETLGDADATITPLTNGRNQNMTATLTNNRVLTLSGTDAKGTTVAKGEWFLIRTSGLGAFTYTIKDGPSAGTILTMGASTKDFIKAVFDGTNWQAMADSTLL